MTAKTLDLPQLIEWHEGMLLTPQHFQQSAARSELLTQFMFTHGGAYRWGLIDLKIDQAALSGGVLRILNIEAVMPDGLLALGGSERGIELEFDLQKAEGNPARIYLILPREAALYDRSDYSRYEAFAAKDEFTSDNISGAQPARIPRVRARLRLASGESNLSGMTALPLIEFAVQGTVSKQTEYIAPLLRMKPGSALTNLCAPVRKKVREKATELASRLSPDARYSDLAGLQQLQWLVSGLPLVEVLLESDQAHPYALYLAFCSMAGSVAFLSHARVPPIFDPYNHNDLRSSFEEVLSFIQLALSEGLIENWIGQLFTKHAEADSRPGDHYFEIAPSLENAFGADADFSAPFLALMLRGPSDAMTAWGESCLLAGTDAIFDLEMSRSRGASCERVDSLGDLVPTPGSVLFRVKNEGKWLSPGNKLVLKAAKQEASMPDAATLFIRNRSQTNKGS
ncbi:MAG TPA: type VI secretion system baseplate subunit TssK [Terracidiphilus sp.]